MNVAIINLKFITKNLIKVLFTIMFTVIFVRFFLLNSVSLNLTSKLFSFDNCTSFYFSFFTIGKEKVQKINYSKIMIATLPILNNHVIEKQVDIESTKKDIKEEIVLSKQSETESVTEKNLQESFSNSFGSVKIKNQSDYTLTEEIFNVAPIISNKKEILIFHTHTCESYTPTEANNYQMTGNYRTTDNNYNVVKVGNELERYLTNKGFKVTHNNTYHDYPTYSGSYTRSLSTVQNLLKGTNTQIVIDLHRDAVGDGDTYGPTIKIDNNKVAQLMFVIGTDSGGLEHPNWKENLKLAIKIQEKGNELYPGLFRPILLSSSRYNQHVTTGASIIEVGATANTLEECLLSMQCLANILEELLK